MSGKFITLEGLDGAGKSTHLAGLAQVLRERGLTVRTTREPGGTALGEKLRQLLLDRDQRLHPETETLLMFAARHEHLDKIIRPALAAGAWVLCDRFTDATFAYQSGGSGVSWARIEALERWVHADLQPDLTVYLDVPPELGRARRDRIKAPDRFEQEAEAFFERVRAAYLRRAREAPARIRVIDASAMIPEIARHLENVLDELIK
ncbi:MAG: dTMP kinase [Betaproteobacteria bacterium RIFCSPLOWO2_02_64_14]|nr:MAG: dTMP kinase [Betaproteobacteria bacterium RIFCSPLOWO2_02_64_14]